MVAGTLYLVGTPIGNLGDMTDRARETLASADLIAAEDTRRTGRLLKHFGIAGKTLSFFEGNERERTAELMAKLRRGSDVALVSDAGMPALSDPGYRLVRACADEGIEVRVVPGPSAALAALVVSALPTDRVAFEGFLPRKAGERRRRLRSLADDPRTLVVFEASNRTRLLLEDVVEALGDRRVAVARELTKLHEETIRGRASEVLDRVGEGLRGEVVVVIEGNREHEGLDLPALATEARALADAGMRKREAAAEVARRHGISANAIYRLLTTN